MSEVRGQSPHIANGHRSKENSGSANLGKDLTPIIRDKGGLGIAGGGYNLIKPFILAIGLKVISAVIDPPVTVKLLS